MLLDAIQLKHWMGSTHFLMKTLDHVPTEMSLHVLAYNLKRNSPTRTVAGGLVGQTSTRCRSSSKATRHFWPSQSSEAVC